MYCHSNAIEASHSDSAMYQAFLDEANKSVTFQRTTHRAFGSSYFGRYQYPKKDSKNCRFRNVILTNALTAWQNQDEKALTEDGVANLLPRDSSLSASRASGVTHGYRRL